MTTNRERVGGRRRRAFATQGWVRPPGLALLALALFGLSQAGCRSDGCYNCNLGQKLSNGVQALAARVTKHFDNCGGGADCGCGIGGETIVDSGTPVISGGIVYPAPATIIPAPALEQPQTQLEPIQSSTSVQPSGNGSATPSSNRTAPSNTNRSSYTRIVPRGNVAQRRGADVNRAVHSTPENANSTDMLDNLPPVDLPAEVTKSASVAPSPSATSAPAPVVANPVNPPAPTAPPAASPSAASAPVPIQDPNTPPAAEKVSAVEGLINSLPPIQTPAPFQEPGIRRYSSVAPAISGGSAPTAEGLDWLKEKGVRTLIDLRKPSEVDSNFVDAVNDRNINYLSLPILANRLEPSRLARFDDLVSQSENRPIFFCDSDGTRAGLCWYIHLRVVGQEDSQSATSKAEEIGLTEAQVKLAEAYLTTNKPRPKVATSRVASAAPTDGIQSKTTAVTTPAPVVPPVSEPARSALPGGSAPTSTEPKTTPVSTPAVEANPSMLPGEDRPQASGPENRTREIAYWRPIAALVMTGLGVPLAYWSRSYFTVSRTIRAKASLPGTVQAPSETPAGSDA